MAISLYEKTAASVALCCLMATACGTPKPTVTVMPSGAVATQILPLSALYVLEVTGIAPADTVLQMSAAGARVITVRHGPPDNTEFAVLRFPAKVFTPPAGRDSVQVSVHPRPGVFGVDLATDAPFGAGAKLVFKYAIHFSAPVGARQKYGGLVRFERALSVAQLQPDGRYALLVTARPASDNLEAPLSGPGTYLVVAPREPAEER